METLLDRVTRQSQGTQESPQRVFEQFLNSYKPMLSSLEDYLSDVIETTPAAYANAYIPWKSALHEILKGAFLITKRIPLPNKEQLMDALQMFSFDSAISFLIDLCELCKIPLKKNWEKEFRESINLLLFTLSSQKQAMQHAPAR